MDTDFFYGIRLPSPDVQIQGYETRNLSAYFAFRGCSYLDNGYARPRRAMASAPIDYGRSMDYVNPLFLMPIYGCLLL